MLVLSRKLNQSIHLGQNITVSIVRIKGNVVQLGIEAPSEIHVLRSELLERDAQSTSNQSGSGSARADSVASEAEMAAGRSLEPGNTTGIDDHGESEIQAALRIISQSTPSQLTSPTMSLFTGS